MKKLSLVAAVILALCALRLVHLEADVPRDLTTWSVGIFVDEGYKTLDARNLVLFGTPNWNPGDDYPGWRNQSPLTHWAYYFSFLALGQHLGSARVVSVLCCAALLAAFAATMWRRYSTGVLLLGLLLLGTGHVLFFFSRIALLEYPLTLVLCLALFVLARTEKSLSMRAVLFFALAAGVATFGIKRSAPIYFAPVGLGLLVASLVGTAGQRRPRSLGLLAGVLVTLLGLTLWLAGNLRLPALEFGPHHLAGSLIWSTLMRSSGPLYALGLGCALHALLVDPRRYLGHPYRASLLALILLGPLTISIFTYQPLRYHTPLLPAYVLLVAEWFHLRTWEAPRPERVPLWAVPPLLALLCWWFACVLFSLHRFVLTPLFWPAWALTDAVSTSTLLTAAVLFFALALWGGCWLLVGRRALISMVLLIAAASARDAYVIGKFFKAPEEQYLEISSWIEEHIDPAHSIAGDWAPMLTLGTHVRSLYMNPVVNQPARIRMIRPDYLLLMGGWPVDRRLARLGTALPQPAVYESSYAGRWVKLLPLEYPEPAPPR